MLQKRYFTTLDAFRTLAFLLVFLAHLPFENFPGIYFFTKSGGLRVTFFFVLSGFLITYILLYEKQLKGTVKLKKFFIRRALRIWPLFYAVLLFAFLTPYLLSVLNLPSSNDGYEPNWLMSALFLENYMMMITGDTPNVSPLLVTWSLCIDEHFYILWGLLFYWVPLKKIHWIFIGAIVLAIVVRIVYQHYHINPIDLFSNLDYFAYGGIPAYLLIRKEALVEKVTLLPSFAKYLLVVITFVLLFTCSNYVYPLKEIITPVIIGGLFGTVILFTLPLGENKLTMKRTFGLRWLSPYTYGLYLFHTIFLNLFIQLFGMVGLKLEDLSHVLLLGLVSLVASVAAAVISYRFFESKFLLLKRYF